MRLLLDARPATDAGEVIPTGTSSLRSAAISARSIALRARSRAAMRSGARVVKEVTASARRASIGRE
jgi:hypothetical protein